MTPTEKAALEEVARIAVRIEFLTDLAPYNGDAAEEAEGLAGALVQRLKEIGVECDDACVADAICNFTPESRSPFNGGGQWSSKDCVEF